MTWLSQRKRQRRRRGAGEATERAVSAAAPRRQRLSPGPVRLSAPGGCESVAAAEESVGGRRAGGSAEDEAAAGRSRRGGGRRAVAATAAPGPGGRARAHGERRPRPTRPPPACSPPRRPGGPGAAWKARRPGRARRPPQGAFRLGLAEQEPRELGGGISVRSRDGTPRPSAWASSSAQDLDGAPPLGLGASEAGEGAWRGSGLTSPRVWGRGHARLGASGPRESSCVLAAGGYDTAEDGCITITRHTQPGNIRHVPSSPAFIFPPPALTGLKRGRGDR